MERGICPIAALYPLRLTLGSYDFLQPMLVSNSNISLEILTLGHVISSVTWQLD